MLMSVSQALLCTQHVAPVTNLGLAQIPYRAVLRGWGKGQVTELMGSVKRRVAYPQIRIRRRILIYIHVVGLITLLEGLCPKLPYLNSDDVLG